MWDCLLGELGLAPRVARALTWPQVDAYLHGYETRRQKEMAGFRLVAAQLYNVYAEKPMAVEKYLPLPAVDPAPKPAPQTANGETAKQFRDRLAAQNAAKIAARAAN